MGTKPYVPSPQLEYRVCCHDDISHDQDPVDDDGIRWFKYKPFPPISRDHPSPTPYTSVQHTLCGSRVHGKKPLETLRLVVPSTSRDRAQSSRRGRGWWSPWSPPRESGDDGWGVESVSTLACPGDDGWGVDVG